MPVLETPCLNAVVFREGSHGKGREIVAIDGKTVRGHFKEAAKRYIS
jgi:hypothetical protein